MGRGIRRAGVSQRVGQGSGGGGKKQPPDTTPILYPTPFSNLLTILRLRFVLLLITVLFNKLPSTCIHQTFVYTQVTFLQCNLLHVKFYI